MRRFKTAGLHILENTISSIIDDPIKTICATLTGLIWHTVDISNFRWSIKQSVLAEFFKHMPRAYNTNAFDNPALHEDFPKLPGKYVDMTYFNGTTIWLEIGTVENASMEDGNRVRLIMKLKCVYTQKNIDNMYKFIKVLVKKSKEIESANAATTYHEPRGVMSIEKYNRKHRSFDNVFIPKEQKAMLTEAVTKFCASEKWYNDHAIPYHFGIMLHGFPGTGKSSIVQVITSMISCDVYYIKSSEMATCMKDNQWIAYASKDRMRVVIVEDIDTMSLSKDRDKTAIIDPTSDQNEANLADILNTMDGFDCIEKVIYIFTTNHLDKLDPALIRPGRIDLSLEIGYVTDETFADFTKFHYDKIPDENYHIRDGVTCAELQTKVMENCPFEKLCEMYSK